MGTRASCKTKYATGKLGKQEENTWRPWYNVVRNDLKWEMQSLKWTSFLDYVTKNKTTTNSIVFQSGKIINTTFRMARMQGGKYPLCQTWSWQQRKEQSAILETWEQGLTQGAMVGTTRASIYLGVFQLIRKRKKKNHRETNIFLYLYFWYFQFLSLNKANY